MSLRPKRQTTHNDLTDEEIEYLQSAEVPLEVRGYLANNIREDIGTKISAYRKIAAAARAEADALIAVRELAQLHGEIVDVEVAKTELANVERRADMLEKTVERKDSEIRRLTAAPALAVHASGAQR